MNIPGLVARPFKVCPGCGNENDKEFGHKYAAYVRLLDVGHTRQQALDKALIFAHCCRMHIAFAPMETVSSPISQEDTEGSDALMVAYMKIMSITRGGGANQIPSHFGDPASSPGPLGIEASPNLIEATTMISPLPGDVDPGSLIETSLASGAPLIEEGKKEAAGAAGKAVVRKGRKKVRRIKR